MRKLTRTDLYSLEDYSNVRREMRAKVIEHKKPRKVHLGPNATLYFEDRLTMRYQIQEMLRIERIFESDGIQEELDAYNPLIPDGSNWKATFMIEFPDEDERRAALRRLIGIEDRVWVQVAGHEKAWAIADEDLDRETQDKTSSVHFLRVELTLEMAAGLKDGADLNMGADHENYRYAVTPVSAATRNSLIADLD